VFDEVRKYAVIGRIEDGALLLDLRCLAPGEESEFSDQLAQLKAG
jgi:L-seryl-tRNA(Ser) seleniumtransferase